MLAALNQSSHDYGGGSYSIYLGIWEGKVGMWMGGLSERGGLTWPRKWTMGWGMLPLPSDAQSATQAMVEGYAIAADTEHHDACWEWIAWLSEQAPYRLMPARRALAESSDYEELVGAEAAAAARSSIENALIVNPMNFGLFEGILDDYSEALSDILQGFTTPMEAMDELQRKAP